MPISGTQEALNILVNNESLDANDVVMAKDTFFQLFELLVFL